MKPSSRLRNSEGHTGEGFGGDTNDLDTPQAALLYKVASVMLREMHSYVMF